MWLTNNNLLPTDLSVALTSRYGGDYILQLSVSRYDYIEEMSVYATEILSCCVHCQYTPNARSEIHVWKWIQYGTGQRRQSTAFRCILVSPADPSQYVSVGITMRADKMTLLK